MKTQTKIINLKKGKTVQRFVFYRNEFGKYATIQVNSELEVYTVTEEFACKQIVELILEGYKVL